MRALSLALILCACGGSTSAPPTPAGPPASVVATSASTDDVQVATVNGKPVWGSCVTAQAAHAKSKQEALDQCIGFELLAQEAEARGLATDPQTIIATRAALVGELVDQEYERKFRKATDFGADWNRLVGKNVIRFDHDEVRGSVYARITLDPKTVTPEQDARAKALAEEIAKGLANERGLLADSFVAGAEKIAAGRAKIDHEIVKPYFNNGTLDKAYADALFAIQEVGRTSPAVRTGFGWDVVLLNELVPAVHPAPDELVAQMLPDVKRNYFSTWVNQIAVRLGVKIKIEEKNLPLLEKF